MTAFREVRDDELEAVLALWREAYGTVGVTDSLDDVLQAVLAELGLIDTEPVTD